MKKASKKKLTQVKAYEAWSIFADYDANAPTTEDLITVATEKLAKRLVDLFNKDPRSVKLSYVEGWEFCKSYQYHRILVKTPSDVARTKNEAYGQADLQGMFDEEEDDNEEI